MRDGFADGGGLMHTEHLPHGGRIEAAARRYPHAPRPFVDLSTGINPVPYPLPPLPAECFTRLPEPEALARLLAVAAGAYAAADPALLAAAPGTQILISLLPRLRPPSRVAVLSPTYGEHAESWRLGGHEVEAVATLAGLEAADVAVVGQPNNPDGARHARGDLLGLADRLAARGGWLVVDEAFADLEPEVESMVPALPHPAVIVLRSFGKSYGLAGVRLGFAAAGAEMAARIAAALGPWAVSGAALAIGQAALADRPWREAAAARLAADAARLDRTLTAAGLVVVGGTNSYRYCQVTDAEGCSDALACAGILVRAFAERPDRLRFGLPGDPAAWARLEAVL